MDIDTSVSESGFRDELLYAGLGDWVSLSQADGRAAKYWPNVARPQRQQLVLESLRTMVVDGLFAVGTLDNPGGRFAPLAEPLDDIVANIRSSYIELNGTARWAFRFWFDLTDKGTSEATSTERGRQLARGIDADLLRRDILVCGRDGEVSLADVRGCLDRRSLVAVAADRPQLILDAVRSLLEAGTVEVGDMPGLDGSKFLSWPGDIDVVMDHLSDRIIGQWAYPEVWEHTTYLNLTATGRDAANRIPAQN